MNRQEWYNNSIQRDNSFHKKVRMMCRKWKQDNGFTCKCVVHHRDDNDEVRAYNEEHYERWGFNDDGTFEDGKYVWFITQSEHAKYHNKGKKHPLYGKHHSEETKEKISTTLSETNMGDKNPNYGKKLSDETKYKIHLANKGRRRSDETKEKISQSAKERMQIISDAYKKYKLEGGMLTWWDFIKQYSKSIQ